MIQLLFDPNIQFSLKNGAINTAGILNVYYDSSSDSKKIAAKTYSDSSGFVLNPFDIVLDNNGRATVYVQSDFTYRLEVYDANRNLLWTTSNIETANGIAVEGQYVFSIKGDEWISVKSKTEGNRVNYDLSLNDYSKDAINGFYDENIGNQALSQKITIESASRTYADGQLATDIKKAKTEVKNTDGTIKVTASTDKTDGHTIYTLAGVESVPNVNVTSSDLSVTVKESSEGNNKTFDLSVNSKANEYGKFITTNGVSWIKMSGNMGLVGSNIALSKGGVYHITAHITAYNSQPSTHYGEFQIFTGDASHYIYNVDESITGSQQFEMSWDQVASLGYLATATNIPSSFTLTNVILEIHRVDQCAIGGNSGGSGENNKVSVTGSDSADFLQNKLVAANGSSLSFSVNSQGQYVADITEAVIENPLLVTTFLMNENGNLGFTGGNWGGDGSWNSYGCNNTTRYYRVTTLGRGTVSKVKLWNYNGSGKIRVCLMNLDGSIKAQSEWREVNTTGLVEMDMIAEYGQNSTIERNTDYWIGICGYGVQLVSFVKQATSFNGDTLRYSVCVRNGGGFPQSGTGWDNPNTDALNNVPTGIPCVYMLAPENK